MEKRNCILYGASPLKEDVLDMVRGAGWQVDDLDRAAPEDLRALQRQARVGLILIAQNDLAQWVAIQSLLAAGGQMRWIALVHPGLTVTNDLLQVLGSGFYDYHVLPVTPERLLFSLYRADALPLAAADSGTAEVFWQDEPLQGVSPATLRFQSAVEQAAQADAPVLLEGASGSGKEAAARSIHRRSWRRLAPFVPFSCSGLSADEIRRDLFGSGDGRFEGDQPFRRGRIDAAQVGVLFLDGIEELPLEIQADLLRLLERNVYQRIGSEEFIPVDVRVMAASRLPLEQAVEAGRFLPELFAALSRIRVKVPTLSERRDDIELLARQILRGHTPDYRNGRLTEDAIEALRGHAWPGNLRELANRVSQGVLLSEGAPISARHLGFDKPAKTRTERVVEVTTLGKAKSQAEKSVIEAALASADLNISRAARQLGISRMTLYRLMDKHRIRESSETAC
jgi:DNA-binding NtrC family response regulator